VNVAQFEIGHSISHRCMSALVSLLMHVRVKSEFKWVLTHTPKTKSSILLLMRGFRRPARKRALPPASIADMLRDVARRRRVIHAAIVPMMTTTGLKGHLCVIALAALTYLVISCHSCLRRLQRKTLRTP
jgi:hypothetical protein